MRSVLWAHEAARAYDELGDKRQRDVDALLWEINQSERPGKALKGEWKGFRSARTGDLRLIFMRTATTIDVYVLDDRRDVY